MAAANMQTLRLRKPETVKAPAKLRHTGVLQDQLRRLETSFHVFTFMLIFFIACDDPGQLKRHGRPVYLWRFVLFFYYDLVRPCTPISKIVTRVSRRIMGSHSPCARSF